MVVLKGDFQRGFDGGGTVVGEEAAVEGGGPELAELFAELGCWGVGEAQERGMGDAIELGVGGGVESRMVVSVKVSPDGRVAIEIGVTVLIE